MTKETLFIYPNDDVKLPYDYHFSHNLAVRLYDDLVWILKDIKTQKKFNVKINFTKSDGSFDSQMQGQQIIDWLLKQGYNDEVDELISKRIVNALISDICHFIYQALDSAKNIRMTVAFSLLRKPFLEHLLIIEQLLTEERSFLKKYETDANNYDPGKITLVKKKNLIENAIKRISSNYFLSQDAIHELRWEKGNQNSIYTSANLATHLVTTRNLSYKTLNQNFNFIFSGVDEWNSQLQYFYYFVPYLLFYSVEIIDQYLLEKKIITLKKFKERKFIRFLGQILQHDQFDDKSYKGKSSMSKFFKDLKVTCKNCNRVNQIFKSDAYYIASENYLLCKFCLQDLLSETNSFRKIINTMISK